MSRPTAMKHPRIAPSVIHCQGLSDRTLIAIGNLAAGPNGGYFLGRMEMTNSFARPTPPSSALMSFAMPSEAYLSSLGGAMA